MGGRATCGTRRAGSDGNPVEAEGRCGEMAVKRLRLQMLGAFDDTTFELVPGINVLLGANSTGKTHALKWLYVGAKTFERKLAAGEDATALLTQKITGVFLPDERSIGKLVKRTQGKPNGRYEMEGDEGKLSFQITSARDRLDRVQSSWVSQAPTTFLPSREVLGLYEGFVAAYEAREISLDETVRDVCVALSAGGVRGPRDELTARLMETIDQVLGGTVWLEGERFYVKFKSEGAPYLAAHLVSEGLRKIASLARLVQNGTLRRNGLLLWDEPEANLNPRLVSAVVGILKLLVREGVQVVIATHDFLLAQRISLLVEAKDPIAARFFLLSREGEGKPVQVASGRTLTDLPRTPMEDEYLRLYDDQRAAFAEE